MSRFKDIISIVAEGLREFFGFGAYKRPAEGWFSWQHVVFVSSLMLIMLGLAIWLGLRNRRRDEKSKNKVLIAAAFLIDGFEIFKIFDTALVLRILFVVFPCKDDLAWSDELTDVIDMTISVFVFIDSVWDPEDFFCTTIVE